MPPQTKDFYERRLAEIGKPDWARLQPDSNEGIERPWCCPDCGTETPNTKLAIKQHRQKCPAKPKPKSQPKDKAKAKAFGASASIKAKAKIRPEMSKLVGTRRCTDTGSRCAPASKRAKTESRSSSAPSMAACSTSTTKPPTTTRTDLQDACANSASTDTSRRDETQDSPAIYFESQVELRCGIHALNHVFGAPYFDVAAMEHAVASFLEENWEVGDEQQAHMGPGGDYSIEVLIMAARTRSMELFERVCWHMEDRRALEPEDLHNCIGAIQNHGGQHWTALRHWNGRTWCLDSLRRAPRVLSDFELAASMRQHPTFAICLI